MTHTLTITDEHGRIVVYAKCEDINFERVENRRERGRYAYDDYEIIQADYPPVNQYRQVMERDRISVNFKAKPLQDGTLIKYYKHAPVDKLAGE